MSKKEETKEVTTTQANEVSQFRPEDFGGNVGLSQRDIVIPKIMAMQGLSKLVVDGVAKFGDMIESLSNEKLGDMKTPIQFIPFHMTKKYLIFKFNGKDFEYLKTEPITAMNDSLPFEDRDENGTQIRRQRVLSFFCVLPGDTSLPYVIDFKGMSSKTGRALATQMYVKNRNAGKVPPAVLMELSGEKVQNDKGVFVVLNVKTVRATTKEEIQTCLDWYNTIATKPVVVHEDADKQDVADSVQF